jgi:hypothetical protein
LSLSVLGALALPAMAHAQFAPVDRPGPPLSVPQGELDASLVCQNSVTNAATTPVLLVPATGVNPHANYSWNWEPALTALGIPWCTVELPGNSMGDIQIAGEYVVNAIRTMFSRAGRQISIMGHSQGGMVPRWALRFWPDTRAMVDDDIGFAPSNHGTIAGDAVCLPGCSPAFSQQRASSEFTKALNSGQETFAGISYTQIYTHTDWVVLPNLDDTGSSSLHTGDGQIENEAIQDICPLDVNEHLLTGTIDPVAYALAIDAVTHPGPADPSRIDPLVCLQVLMPGINPLTFATDLSSAALVLTESIAAYPHVAAEPDLRCYAFVSCPAQGSAGAGAGGQSPYAGLSAVGKKCKKGKKRHRKARAAKKRGCKHKRRRRRH